MVDSVTHDNDIVQLSFKFNVLCTHMSLICISLFILYWSHTYGLPPGCRGLVIVVQFHLGGEGFGIFGIHGGLAFLGGDFKIQGELVILGIIGD